MLHDVARASVERIISDVGDRGTPGYWLEKAGVFKPRSIDMFCIWELFGSVISSGS
jgi:hypothetical protein